MHSVVCFNRSIVLSGRSVMMTFFKCGRNLIPVTKKRHSGDLWANAPGDYLFLSFQIVNALVSSRKG
jgi:hypothetical protein